MEVVSLVASIIAIIIGAVITFAVSKNYYERASKELLQESEQLRRLNTLILRGLEEGGIFTLSRDSEGNICGLALSAEAKFCATSKMTIDPP